MTAPSEIDEVVVVGLRGSDEPEIGHDGMGPTVSSIARRLAVELTHRRPHVRCELVGIRYPALRPHWNAFTGRLRTSVAIGSRMLLDAVAASAKAWPRRRVVIIGLSQGAAAAHMALAPLATVRDGETGRLLSTWVDAVLLYADPLRLGGCGCNRPVEVQADGALTWVWRLRLPPPAEFDGKLLSFCDVVAGRADPVCAFRPNAGWLLSMRRNSIHTSYADPERSSGWIGPAFAADRVLAAR